MNEFMFILLLAVGGYLLGKMLGDIKIVTLENWYMQWDETNNIYKINTPGNGKRSIKDSW